MFKSLVTKKLFILSILGMLLCVMTSAFAQSSDYSKFTGRLIDELSSRKSGEIPLYIMLDEQIDVAAYKREFDKNNLPVSDRARTLNLALRAKAEETQTQVIKQLEAIGVSGIKPFWVVNSIYFNATIQQLDIIKDWKEVKWIDFNAPLEIESYEQVSIPEEETSKSQNTEPGLRVIQAPKMWARGYTGYGRKAFIMDTGIDPHHPTLARNYAGHVYPEDQVWFGFLDPDGRPYDCQTHGTHVTGTILGIDRAEKDTIGVAFNSMWMGAPILLVCGGNTEIRMAGFQWAMDPDNDPNTSEDMPDVINNSWTDTRVDFCFEVYEQLLTVVEAAGIAVVFAAGNDGPGASTISQPKNINTGLVNTFAVGALNASNLDIAGFSSRGPSRCGGEGSLNIKPEVSAPGVAVRSALPGKTYGALNGTSMAAPHAAGAVLLLKEAFPYLSGEQVLLALYYSAVDLGVPGEDNIYGMGLIDVDAAFEYLVQQGYQAVSPISKVDLAIHNYDFEVDICQNTLQVELELQNQGEEVIDAWLLSYVNTASNLQLVHTDTIYESLLPGEYKSRQLIFKDLSHGAQNFLIQVIPFEKTDEKDLNNQIRVYFWLDLIPDSESVQIISSHEGPYCAGTNLLLEAKLNGGNIFWDILDPQNPINSSSNPLLLQINPTSSSNVPLLVAYQMEEFKSMLSSENITNQAELPANTNYGIQFTMSRSAKLNHLRFELSSRGLITLQLNESGGSTVFSRSMIYNNSDDPFLINALLSAGKSYDLTIRSNRAITGYYFDDLSKDINGLIRFRQFISELDEGGGNQLRQHVPFHDIQFSAMHPCVMDTLYFNIQEVDDAPIAEFSIENNASTYPMNLDLYFENLSVNASSYFWDFGDGNESQEFEPVHRYEGPGVYQIQLRAVSDEDCTDVYLSEITIEEPNSTNKLVNEVNTLSVFPNPAKEMVNFSLNNSSNGIVSVDCLDLFGKKIQNVQYAMPVSEGQIELSKRLPSGMYIFRFHMNNTEVLHQKVMLHD
jgi:subtilisin family serine protease